MDDAWERAVEAALEGQASSSSSPRTLTLDGAVKCLHGRLPPPSLLERFPDLEHLSIANTGVSYLDNFPKLRRLRRLILSDNRIAAGLDLLVAAGPDSLRDLDLSNNRIQTLSDLAPLAKLRLVSLDLYECPVTRVKDYRSKVFGMIPSLKYLDKTDADGNERPESDDDEEDDEEDDDDEEEIDGNGEIDGEDEESDADEEEPKRMNGNGHSNGFHVAARDGGAEDLDEDEENDDDDYDEDENLDEEIDEDDDGEDAVLVHDVVDSDEEDEGNGVGQDEEDVEDETEVDPQSSERLVGAEGEIDGHDQGEEDVENGGEIGEADEQDEEVDLDSEEEGEDEVDSQLNYFLMLN